MARKEKCRKGQEVFRSDGDETIRQWKERKPQNPKKMKREKNPDFERAINLFLINSRMPKRM